MPFFKTKRAMAMMGNTNACKKPKLEPEQPPPQSKARAWGVAVPDWDGEAAPEAPTGDGEPEGSPYH